MKPKYRPTKNSRQGIERAKLWYAGLEHDDKVSVDKKIARAIVTTRKLSNTQFSHEMGVELIYKLLTRRM